MTDKSIFITGASAGIGRATAKLFAKNGWFTGLFDLDEEGLETLALEVGKGRCVTGRLDVTDPASVDRAFETFAAATGGKLKVLFNCAGILQVGAFEKNPRASNAKQIAVNLTGLVDCTVRAFPLLKATEGAQVISMSSASAIYGIPDFATYSATKHAVRALTEALDIEWEAHGIHVCDIMPPFVNTGMVKNANPSKVIDRLGVNITAEDVAKTVWLAAQDRKEVHWPVGRQFKILWAVAKNFNPALQRTLLRRMWNS